MIEFDEPFDEWQDGTIECELRQTMAVREPSDHTPPVTYDNDVPTTTKLAKFIFKNGFETCELDKRLSEFYAMRKVGLFSLDVKPELAEAKVTELLKIYL